MKLRSVRQKVLLAMLPLAIIPVLLAGIAGILYFMDVTKQNIDDDNLAQARALALYTGDYINTSITYLEAMAERPYLVAGMAEGNFSFASTTAEYAAKKSDFEIVYITDLAGRIKSSYPDPHLRVGRDYANRPYVSNVLSTGKPYVSGPFVNLSGHPEIFASVPVNAENGTLLGVMVGQINPDAMAARFFGSQVKNTQYVYMVNESGIVMIHSNRSYMQDMADFSSLDAIRQVTMGESGVTEKYNPIERATRLAAYAPVPGTGWGVVVALPVSVAYQPAYNSAIVLAVLTALIAAAAGILAWFLGKGLAEPIIGVSMATKRMTNGGDYRRYLPLRREDEIGELARSFDDMSLRIRNDKERIVEEKNRAELYLDIMGHDINNFNQAALSNLELIEGDENLDEGQNMSVAGALAAIRSSSSIIDSVRTVQRINQERLDIEPQDLDVIIRDSVAEAPKPPGKKVAINYRPRPGLVVKGNPLLKEVFSNFIDNSIKYSGDEVTIDVDVKEIEKQGRKFYRASVADNGPGVPDDVKPRLFYRFTRGTTRAQGKGLGLYIVRTLVEKLGGWVELEDRVPGDYTKGAKFIVVLPACEECKK
jgi:signal transduction histidine kinase